MGIKASLSTIGEPNKKAYVNIENRQGHTKARRVAESLRKMKLKEAAKKVEDSVEETLA